MPGSDALWSVHSGAYTGISARPCSTRSAQRRSSRFGSRIDMTSALRFVQPEKDRPGRDDLLARDAHRVPLGHAVDHERERFDVVDAGCAFELAGDVGQIHVASEIPARAARSA